MAKSPYKTQKKKTWNACSKYVRTRDCLLSTGSPEYGRCYTCGTEFHITKLDAGHYLPGHHMATFFDTRGIHIQCVSCNRTLEGNRIIYHECMLRDYGKEIVAELWRLDKGVRKYSIAELKELEAEFNQKTAILLEGVLV